MPRQRPPKRRAHPLYAVLPWLINVNKPVYRFYRITIYRTLERVRGIRDMHARLFRRSIVYRSFQAFFVLFSFYF